MKSFLEKHKLIITSVVVALGGILLIVSLVPQFFPPVKVDLSTEIVKAQIEKPETGATAPDFTLFDLSGKKVTLSNYRGKVVLITFWATWHPLSTEQLPVLEKLYKSQRVRSSSDIVILAINNGESKSVVANFSRDNYTLPILLDSDSAVGNKYNLTGLPAHYFVGKDGKIKEVFIGVLNEEELWTKLNQAR